MERAASSFPVPVSPVIRTGEGLSATRLMIRSMVLAAGLPPMMLPKNPASSSGFPNSPSIRTRRAAGCPSCITGRVVSFVARPPIMACFSNRWFPSVIFFTVAAGKICQREVLDTLHIFNILEAS